MLTTLQDKKTTNNYSFRVDLDEGSTSVHVVKYAKEHFAPRLVNLKTPTRLLDWCEANEVHEAMGGGFFAREAGKVLGDLWIDGKKHDFVPVESPWHKVRGSLHIYKSGQVGIGHRDLFQNAVHHLLQAGPLLLQNRKSVVDDKDREGLSAGSTQFDSDITKGRYPRAAIGVCEDFIWSVVCDGRSVEEAGLTLSELAGVMKDLGIKDALNLDGGASATQITKGKLVNKVRGLEEMFTRGRPIYSAIVFDRKIKKPQHN